MLIASLTPLLGGLILPHLKIKSRKMRTVYVEAVTLLASLLVLRLLKTGAETVTLIDYSTAFRLSFGLDGMGKVFLGLIGIPPTGGFISKWYLAEGALTMSGAASWIGPAVLLCSALMTAGYLLTITIHGFFPGESAAIEGREAPKAMWIPMLVLAILSVLVGLFPNALIVFIQAITSALFA